MENIQNYITEWFSTYGINVLYAIVIFIIGRMIAKTLSKIAVKAMNKANMSITLSKFFIRNNILHSLSGRDHSIT